MNSKNQLEQKLARREAVIGIFGMGYVGQPLALRYSQLGYRVIGFDIDQNKVDLLNSGRSDIEHIPGSAIRRQMLRAWVHANINRSSEADALVICVPTAQQIS